MLLLLTRTAHNGGWEDTEDSYLRGIGSVHNRNNSDDNIICASRVSNKYSNTFPEHLLHKVPSLSKWDELHV